MHRPIITLLTDFGLGDGYVASMKGVILSICPEATLIDITHDVPPQRIETAAFLLRTVHGSFPRGTIHVVVVDPGVGTQRKGVAIRTPDAVLVGPDNGVFSHLLQTAAAFEAVSLENAQYHRPAVSPTFHGRDVFAPTAGHLANGVPLESFGPPFEPVVAEWMSPRLEAGRLIGQVIHIDRFGNVITNITTQDLRRFFLTLDRLNVHAAGHDFGTLCRTYGDRPAGALLALMGSSDHLELSVNMGSCAQELGLGIGDSVQVEERAR